MPGSKRFLHPEAIKRISRLEVRARHIVEGFLSGMHKSPYFGQSVEFLQHREYVTGDDLRHVDWKVWARQDRLYVKQFEEETNLRCTMLVDISNSRTPSAAWRLTRKSAARSQPAPATTISFPLSIPSPCKNRRTRPTCTA